MTQYLDILQFYKNIITSYMYGAMYIVSLRTKEIINCPFLFRRNFATEKIEL